MWLGTSGSSPARRGHDRVVRPSRRTKRRGAAARWLAGHQTAHAPGIAPIGKTKLLQREFERLRRRAAQRLDPERRVPRVRAASRRAASAAPAPLASISRTGMIIGRTSTPSARRAWASSSARRHCSSSKSAAPGRRPCAQLAGSAARARLSSGGMAEKPADAILA